MKHSVNAGEGNPFEMKKRDPSNVSNGRLIIKNSSFDCPMAIEERETRYFEYQPVMREESKQP